MSDDALRYLWDGKVAAAGLNPYALAPAAEQLIPLRDGIWRRLPHKQIPTVYPPLAIAAFSIASRLPFPLLAWKLIAAGADLLACWLLLCLARRLGVPEGRAAWYAWNPLVALEVAGMGHVDALGVAAMVGAVLWLIPSPSGSRRPGVAASLAAAGALAKLVPLAALPLWARHSGRPWRFLGMAGGLVALALLPVLAATGGVPPGLIAYGVSWEFNGPVYEPLWRLLDALGAAPALARGLDRLKEWTEIWEAWNPVYPYLYPQFLAKLALAAGAGLAVLLSLRERDPVAGTGRLFGRLLLLSATVYPWYLLWVLPWAACAGWPGRGVAGAFGVDPALVSAAVPGGGVDALGLSGDLGAVCGAVHRERGRELGTDGHGRARTITDLAMPTYRLHLSYRGTAYAGWQRQENALTVQQVAEEALERLLGEPVRIAGASRTDAGVHARGQVAHLELPRPFPERGLVHGTNHHLPEDVRVMAAAAMPDGFHARKHALGKEYAYRLSRRRSSRPWSPCSWYRSRRRSTWSGWAGQRPACPGGTTFRHSRWRGARTDSRSGVSSRRTGRRRGRSCASAWWARASCAAWFVLWWGP